MILGLLTWLYPIRSINLIIGFKLKATTENEP
jgi:hypothetical protein